MKKAHPRLLFRSALLGVFLGIAICICLFRDSLIIPLTAVLADTEENSVPTCTVEKSSYTVAIPADGEITGLQSISIQTPRTGTGALTLAWLVPEGSTVQAGETVVRFDDTEARLSLEKEQNALAANEQQRKIARENQQTEEKTLAIDLAEAGLEYQHLKDLIPEDRTIFSRWDIIDAQLDAGLAKSRIDFLAQKTKTQSRIARAEEEILNIEKNKAEAEMKLAQQALDSLEVASPVSGVVLYVRDRGREPQLGDQCWPGQALIEIVDPGALQARLQVLERDAGGLKAGMEVNILLDAFPDKSLKGTLESVAPMAYPLERNSPLRYFACDVSFQGSLELKGIRPGMGLRGEIIMKRYDSCFVVPSGAVTTKGAEHMVYIRQDEDFVPRQVQTAPGSQGLTLVVHGIQSGETIALHNPFESRKLYLPDFGKAAASTDSPARRMRMDRRR
jgi:HlyD family secretion protein